jgi:hypothetical protein
VFTAVAALADASLQHDHDNAHANAPHAANAAVALQLLGTMVSDTNIRTMLLVARHEHEGAWAEAQRALAGLYQHGAPAHTTPTRVAGKPSKRPLPGGGDDRVTALQARVDARLVRVAMETREEDEIPQDEVLALTLSVLVCTEAQRCSLDTREDVAGQWHAALAAEVRGRLDCGAVPPNRIIPYTPIMDVITSWPT